MSHSRVLHCLTAAALVVGLSLSGCSSDESGAENLPDNASSPSAEQQAAFVVPEKGDAIGESLRARPADQESATGAADFAGWALGILAYTPRTEESRKLWATTFTACEQCQKVAAAWQAQADAGQEFRYTAPPKFAGVATAPAKQGAGWFVQLELDVPSAALTESGKPAQKTKAERLGYSFNLAWQDKRWTITDFRVLATGESP